MNNQQFIDIVKQFSLNVMSSNSTDEPWIIAMANISLINLFQVMNSKTTIRQHSFVTQPVESLEEVTLINDPLKIIEISSKSWRLIANRMANIEMVTNWNGRLLDPEDSYNTLNYEITGKEIKFDRAFTWNIFYVRQPILFTEDNFSLPVDFPPEVLGYIFFHTLFNLMPFVLSEGRTLANWHYEHARELLENTVSLMNTWLISFTT